MTNEDIKNYTEECYKNGHISLNYLDGILRMISQNRVLREQLKIQYDNAKYYGEKAERKERIIQKVWYYAGYITDNQTAQTIFRILDGDDL